MSDTIENAPANSLPTWLECCTIIENNEFRIRAAKGLEGQVLDTPPTTPIPSRLHEFIYEYDDADDYRSTWFMHRLDAVVQETRQQERDKLMEENAELKRRLFKAETDRGVMFEEYDKLKAQLAEAQTVVDDAMKKSWHLGQVYWQQADSEYTSQHKKADATVETFRKLHADTVAMLAAAPTYKKEG